MTDDFMSVAGYGGASSQPSTQQSTVDPDTDAAVRTAYAEAGKDGWAAVANVIRNRAVASGKPFGAVVAEPNAFEGYGNAKYKSLKAGSPQYQAILQAITPALQGQDRPVGDADAYYSPEGQKAKGRSAPDWSSGKQPAATIGGNVFYNGVYAPKGSAPAPGDFMATAGWHGPDPTDLPEATPGAPAQVAQEPLPAPIARPQKLEDSSLFMGYGGRGQPVFDTLAAGSNTVRFGREANRDLPSPDPNLPTPPKGYYWPEGVEMGADGQPRLDMGPHDPNRAERFDPKLVNDQATAWRLSLTPSGQEAMAQAANAPDANNPGDSGVLGHAANGLMQGWFPAVNGAIGYGQQALINGVNRLTGQPITVSAKDAGDAERLGTDMLLREESAYHPNTAPIAEVGGSLTSAIPAVEGGVALLRNVPKVGAFLAGDAGAGDGALNLLTRTASRGVSGGIQGVTGGALTTGLTDKDVGENMLSGGVWGGGLGAGGSLAYDTLRGGAAAIKAAAQPFSEQGRNEIVGDVLRNFSAGGPTDLDLTEYVPGSTPTLAQATGNAGLAATERAVRQGNPSSENAFRASLDAADEARAQLLQGIRGDANTLANLRANRDQAVDAAIRSAFTGAKAADSAPVVSAIDAELASPTGQTPDVRSALQSARNGVVGKTSGLTSGDQDAFIRGVTGTFGDSSPTLDRTTMAKAKDTLGQRFQAEANNTDIQITPEHEQRLLDIIDQAKEEGYDTTPIEAAIKKITSAREADGHINGAAYQTLTKKGGALDRLAARGGGYDLFAGDINNVLNDALENSTTGDAKARIQDMRSQYRNMKIVEQAMRTLKPGETLDPDALYSSVVKNNKNYVYSGGQDLGDLAESYYQKALPRPTFNGDPAQLYGVRGALQKVVDAGGPGAASAQRVIGKIDDTIENAAPGYKDFLAKQAAANKAVDEQVFLQNHNFTDANGRITQAKVKGALENIRKSDVAAGKTSADAVSPKSEAVLNALYQDLSRAASAAPDRSLGSNTFQNLATNNLMSRLGVPVALADAVGLHALPIPGWASGLAGLATRAAYQSKNPLILDQLTNALVNPRVGAELLRSAPPNANKVLGVAPLSYQIPRIAGAGATARNLLMNYRPSGAAEAVP